MALNNLHAILIREARIVVIEQQIEKAKNSASNEEYVDLLATKRRLQAEIKEMKRA